MLYYDTIYYTMLWLHYTINSAKLNQITLKNCQQFKPYKYNINIHYYVIRMTIIVILK